MRKLIAIVLMLGMALTWGDAMGAQAPLDSAERPKLTVLMHEENSPVDDNPVIMELREQTGIDVDIIYVNSADYNTRLSAMVAAGNVPDIFTTDVVTGKEFKDAGLLADISGLVEQYGDNFKANLGDEIYNCPLNDDGIYMINNAKLDYVLQLNFRTDWLKNLDMELPVDLDSMYDVLYAYTHGDPDGNGRDDTFGICANNSPALFASVFGAYGIPVNQQIELEDGTVSLWVKHPQFLNAMEFIRKIVRDGLAEPDWATIAQLEMFGKLWNGAAGAIEWQCVGPTNNWMRGRYVEDPKPTFDFPIIRGPEGMHGTPMAKLNLGEGWVFSSACENLEAAVKFGNYCMSEEGNELLYLGVEGLMFEWVDRENGEYEMLGKYTDSATHRADGGYIYWFLFTPRNNAELRTLNKQTREGVALAQENGIDYVKVYDLLQSRVDYGADMDQVISEMYMEMLNASGDLQQIYDEKIAEWESVGGRQWEEEITAAWNAKQ